jgi:hypothetical protein
MHRLHTVHYTKGLKHQVIETIFISIWIHI